MQRIEFDGVLYAMIIKAKDEVEKLKYYTPKDFPLQLCMQKRTEDVQPHMHNKIERKTDTTQEIIYIIEGEMIVDFYDMNKNKVGDVTIETGDLILFCGGGHGMKMVKESVFFEVKNGPYISPEEDKQKF